MNIKGNLPFIKSHPHPNYRGMEENTEKRKFIEIMSNGKVVDLKERKE